MAFDNITAAFLFCRKKVQSVLQSPVAGRDEGETKAGKQRPSRRVFGRRFPVTKKANTTKEQHVTPLSEGESYSTHIKTKGLKISSPTP